MTQKQKQYMTMTVVAVFAVVLSLIAFFSNWLLGGKSKAALESAKTYQEIVSTISKANVTFKIQVQEWKNILIRGTEKELFDKHLKAFESKEAEFKQALTKAKDSMVTLGLNAESEEVSKVLNTTKNWVKNIEKHLKGSIQRK